jgi:hypothetical protein
MIFLEKFPQWNLKVIQTNKAQKERRFFGFLSLRASCDKMMRRNPLPSGLCVIVQLTGNHDISERGVGSDARATIAKGSLRGRRKPAIHRYRGRICWRAMVLYFHLRASSWASAI